MSSNRKSISTTSSYEVWQPQFFRDRVALACKLSMLFFGISGLFSGLMIYSDRSSDIWDLRLNILSLLLSGIALWAIDTARGNTRPKFVFIALSLLLLSTANLETSVEGIVLSNEFSSVIFLVLAVLIPTKLSLHLISQIGIVLVYFLLSRAIAVVHDGAIYLDPQIAKLVVANLKPVRPNNNIGSLSEREIEVLELIVEGKSNPQIARTLHLSPNTIKTHVRSIMNKLTVNDRVQAAVVALRSGLI